MAVLLLLLVLLAAAAAAVIRLLSAPLRRIDVTVRSTEPLFRRALDASTTTTTTTKNPTAAAAARRYAARLVGVGASSSAATPTEQPQQQAFSLPGPAPALAPFVLAGWLRGVVSRTAMFLTLLCGGARQLLPTAAEGKGGGGKAKTTTTTTTPPLPWLAGDVDVQGGEEARDDDASAEVRIRARTLAPSTLAHPRWFRDVEARVVFEREEKEGGPTAAPAGVAASSPSQPPPPRLLLLRARAEVTVRGVPALLEGAACAAVEQAHARLARDVATELMQRSSAEDGGGSGWGREA